MNNWLFGAYTWNFRITNDVISLTEISDFPNAFEEGKYLRSTSNGTEWNDEGIIIKVDNLPSVAENGRVVFNKQDNNLYLFKEE